MRARLTAHPDLTAAAIFAVLAIVFVGQSLLPGRTLSTTDNLYFYAPWAHERPTTLTRPANLELEDGPEQLQPFLHYSIAALPSIPLWNPHIMTGRPFEADAQSAIFSPFSLPAYVLGFYTALGWIAALKLWTAGFGMFLLGRRLGMRFGGAMLAGVTYGFSLWEVTWLSYPHASVWALIPWMMVATERAIRRPDIRGAAPLAVVVGLQFLSGHPESSFHAVLATTVYFAIRMAALRPAWRRPLAAFAGSMVLGTALAAVLLLPFTELLLRSADIHQRAGSAQHVTPQTKFLISGFLPDWFGRQTQHPILRFLLARAWYAGALALMLGAVSLILRPSRGRLLIAALGTACMMVVLALPPVFQIVTHLPIFSAGHNGRLTILAILCLALLAGFGLDDLLAGVGTVRRRRAALASAAAIFLVPLAYVAVRGGVSWGSLGHGLDVAWGFSSYNAHWPRLDDVVHASALWIWIVVAGAGLAVVAAATLWRRRLGAGLLAVLAVTVAYGDLARAGMGYNPAIKRSVATQPQTPAIALLRSAGNARFVSIGRIPQNTIAMRYGLYEARGYDLPIEQRFDHLWRTALSPEFPSQTSGYFGEIPLVLPKVTPDRLRVLGVMGTRYVVQPPTDPVLHVPGLTVVRPGPDLRVYRNADEQPRAAVVGAQTVARNGAAALADIVAPRFRIDRLAVTEHPIAGLPTTTTARAPAPAGTARITQVRDDSMVVRATASRPGMLVVSDAWAPGWTATVDGHPATVHRVDYVFRGVRIGAGRHRVVFRYDPLSFRVGWIVSLVALLGLLGALGISWWRPRRVSPGASPGAPPTGGSRA